MFSTCRSTDFCYDTELFCSKYLFGFKCKDFECKNSSSIFWVSLTKSKHVFAFSQNLSISGSSTRDKKQINVDSDPANLLSGLFSSVLASKNYLTENCLCQVLCKCATLN